MRRKTLEAVLADMMFPAPPTHEVIAVVEVTEFPKFKRLCLELDIADAERAQLRMLLKTALAQLAQVLEAAKVESPEYKRLLARSQAVLTAKAGK